MDPSIPNPPIMPQSQTPPVYGPVAEAPKVPTPPQVFHLPQFQPWMILAIVIVTLILGFFAFASKAQKKNTITPTLAPTVTPTPTPMQILTPFASSSAFMEFEKNVTALPDMIQKAVLQDQTITPPILDLNLGFSN
jgi:hypothetical protein